MYANCNQLLISCGMLNAIWTTFKNVSDAWNMRIELSFFYFKITLWIRNGNKTYLFVSIAANSWCFFSSSFFRIFPTCFLGTALTCRTLWLFCCNVFVLFYPSTCWIVGEHTLKDVGVHAQRITAIQSILFLRFCCSLSRRPIFIDCVFIFHNHSIPEREHSRVSKTSQNPNIS